MISRSRRGSVTVPVRPSATVPKGAALLAFLQPGGHAAELVDAAEEHLEHIANDVSQRSVMAPPTTGGDTA